MTDTTPMHLVFMLEEESAKHLLEVLMPKILPPDVTVKYITHQGKGDLQKSIPIKLKAWRDPNAFFIILHDQDNHDCVSLKNELQELCSVSNSHNPLIRIVCRELEAWYFGDLDAVQLAFPRFRAAQYKHKRKYRVPDDIVKPSEQLKRIVTGFDKTAAARIMPQHMDINNNTSTSFHHMITGVRNLGIKGY